MIKRFAIPVCLISLAVALAAFEHQAAKDADRAEFSWTIEPTGTRFDTTTDRAFAGETAATKRIRISAPLENSWMKIRATALRDDGTVEDSRDLYIEYYLRPRRGIHWTWGSSVASALLDLPAGDFQLQLHVESNPKADSHPPVLVEVLPRVSGSLARLIGCGVSAVFGVGLLLRALATLFAERRQSVRKARDVPSVLGGDSTKSDPFPGGRLHFIDGLRGIAALSVLVCHLFVPEFLPSARLFDDVAGGLISVIARKGYLGVEIFFVLSGFVIAYSIRRYRVTPGFTLRFIFRRFLRLDPPYYLAIFLAILIIASRRADSLHVVLEYLQGWKGLLMNAAYLQDIFVYRSPIGTVAWTLCLEVQFYLALIILTGIAGWLAGIVAPRDSRGVAAEVTWWLLLGTLAIVSAVMWYTDYNGLNFFGTWHRFFLGVLTFRSLAARANPWPLAALLLVLMALSIGFDDPRGFTAASTAGLILLAGKRGALDRWLCGRVWQFLGRTSYSLYLYHVVLAIPFLRLAWSYMPNNLNFAAGLVVFGILVAIVGGWIMHVLIERPSVALSRRVSYTKRQTDSNE